MKVGEEIPIMYLKEKPNKVKNNEKLGIE